MRQLNAACQPGRQKSFLWQATWAFDLRYEVHVRVYATSHIAAKRTVLSGQSARSAGSCCIITICDDRGSALGAFPRPGHAMRRVDAPGGCAGLARVCDKPGIAVWDGPGSRLKRLRYTTAMPEAGSAPPGDGAVHGFARYGQGMVSCRGRNRRRSRVCPAPGWRPSRARWGVGVI